jgi:hypothetical protein
MNIKFFETKEQYLAFRAAWKAAVNDDRAKPFFTEGATRAPGYQASIIMARTKHNGWIQAEHHILFNLVRGKEPTYGFTPVTNPSKLAGGTTPWLGYNQALLRLRYLYRNTKRVADETYDSYIERSAGWLFRGKDEEYKRESYARFIEMNMKDVNKFLEPFNGTFTVDDLLKLELPEEIK